MALIQQMTFSFFSFSCPGYFLLAVASEDRGRRKEFVACNYDMHNTCNTLYKIFLVIPYVVVDIQNIKLNRENMLQI